MHFNTFDHYQNSDSLVHRLDPRIKLTITLLYILSSALLPDGAWLAYFAGWLLIAVISGMAGVGLRFLLTRSIIALPFALAAITLIFTVPGEPALAVQAGPWLLVASWPGIIRFASIMLRSWLSVQTAILLTATTPFPDLLNGMRHLRVPAILISIVGFMYRYLFVLADEVLRLLRAREARSAGSVAGQKTGGTLGWRARIAGNMAGQLFLRSYERSDRVYNAMLARGYQGVLLTMHQHELKTRDWVVGGAAVAAIITIQLIGRWFG